MEERFGRYHPDMEAMHRGFRTLLRVQDGGRGHPVSRERHMEEYQGLQRLVYRVTETVSQEMAALAARIGTRLG